MAFPKTVLESKTKRLRAHDSAALSDSSEPALRSSATAVSVIP